MQSKEIELAGELVLLHAARVLSWPREATVFAADLHLGKGEAFRRAGIAVPAGSTENTLSRLEQVLEALAPRRLVLLGDLFHARPADTSEVRARLRLFRERAGEIEIVLVRGNHDRGAGDPDEALGIVCVNEPYTLTPFACCHHPETLTEAYRLAGHVHPAVRLRGPTGDKLRLPCFLVGPHRTLLPSFGSFTGSHTIHPAPDEKAFVLTDATLHELP